jgi:NTP pyrophosphatase (non-canonical NTP hydrolase)
MTDRLDFDTYQKNAERTSGHKDSIEFAAHYFNHVKAYSLPYPTYYADLAISGLGIAGEAGEVADLLKKICGHGHRVDADTRTKLRKELGDVLWYISDLSSLLGFTLEEVAADNIYKLKQRYPEGFSSEASQNRKD